MNATPRAPRPAEQFLIILGGSPPATRLRLAQILNKITQYKVVRGGIFEMRQYTGWRSRGCAGEIIAVSLYEPVVYIHHRAEKQLLRS